MFEGNSGENPSETKKKTLHAFVDNLLSFLGGFGKFEGILEGTRPEISGKLFEKLFGKILEDFFDKLLGLSGEASKVISWEVFL